MAHRPHLETLKKWLQESSHPGDREKLIKTLQLIRKMDVKLGPEERSELRGLIRETFQIDKEELEELFPEIEDIPEPLITGVGRGELPKLSPLLDTYLALTASSESPSSFHIFSLLSLLGAELKRRCWLDMTFFKVWPNLSVVLTGPAGGPRKTSCCDMAQGMVKAGLGGLRTKEIVDATPQALIQDLEEDGTGLIYAPEFRHFFPSQKFMEGTIPLITRLLDNPDYYPVSRVTRSAKPLRNVTLSMLGGSTLDWLAKLPSDAQGGGFLTRVLIVHEERARKAQPLPIRAAAAEMKRLMSAVGQIGKGEIRMSEDAKRWYSEWYRALRERRPGHPRLILYYNRKQIHLLKLAMLMWLPEKTLRAWQLQRTVELLDWIEVPLGDVYKIIGMTKSGEMTKQLLDMLMANGGRMEYERLVREMKGSMNLRDFRMAFDTLMAGGQLIELNSPAARLVAVKELSQVE